MKTLQPILLGVALMFAALTVNAQTKMIAHKSHSGKVGTFSVKGEGNLGAGNMGLGDFGMPKRVQFYLNGFTRLDHDIFETTISETGSTQIRYRHKLLLIENQLYSMKDGFLYYFAGDFSSSEGLNFEGFTEEQKKAFISALGNVPAQYTYQFPADTIPFHGYYLIR